MNWNNQGVMVLMSSLVLLMAGSGTHQALALTVTKQMMIKLKVEQPTCSLTLPDSVPLGSLPEGTHARPPFSITAECETPVRTTLYAQVVSGILSAGSADRMEMTGSVGGTPVKLWMADEDGQNITLNGSGSTDSSKGFCSGTERRNCILTPYTQVAANTPPGDVSATLRFSMTYQ
ncbi:TPA: fimbrial protein [Salmonella enterica subsp. enterica serovar Stanley]|nr:fimbrial protein [Salmonella enterica]MBJ3181886.1 fimbrial protein [Salmonella enterica subsp. enterica serovar Stanley]HAK5463365.1 fimbrial protein [Salmonella enterica]HEC8294114.1 fimbrial protein [Salmonella enterica subsp. enterica serovar Stanley]